LRMVVVCSSVTFCKFLNALPSFLLYMHRA